MTRNNLWPVRKNKLHLSKLCDSVPEKLVLTTCTPEGFSFHDIDIKLKLIFLTHIKVLYSIIQVAVKSKLVVNQVDDLGKSVSLRWLT